MAVEIDTAAYGSFDHIIGEVLASRYRIEERLGEGAMGAVYRAKHVKVGRPFAVKVLHPRLLEDAKQLQRFEREAELAGRLRHPNVIGVVDVGDTTDGMRYMVMDFAEGPDLATLMSEAPFTPARIINLTRQMLEGLYHAHEAGLIHRDFKPENVIVEKDTHGVEVPRIVDFGIAILREGGESNTGPGRLTTNGLVLGTPHYMAPEQAVADPIDHRIDLFALGIILYEMLCGKLPFDGNGAEVARANLLLDPPPISERVPYLEVDPLLEAFARKLMAKKRDLRPANAKIARDLLDLVARDRAAAAAALGVPLANATRAPQTTQDAQPLPRATGNDTFPPPVREVAKHATTGDVPRARRRAPMIAAIVVGVGIVGAGAVFVLKGKPEEAARTPEPVAVAEPPVTQAAPPARTPAAPAPAPAPAVAPPVAAPAEPVAPQAGPPVAKPKAKKPAPKPATKAIAVAKPDPKPAETKPAEPPPKVVVTATTLSNDYARIGKQIIDLQNKGVDGASELFGRYRNLRINEYFGDQQKLDQGAAILAKLAHDTAALKR